jgi:hypothetical protein
VSSENAESERVEQRVLAELTRLRARTDQGVHTSVLAAWVYGPGYSAGQRIYLARVVAELRRRGLVEILPVSAMRRRRHVRLVKQ